MNDKMKKIVIAAISAIAVAIAGFLGVNLAGDKNDDAKSSSKTSSSYITISTTEPNETDEETTALTSLEKNTTKRPVIKTTTVKSAATTTKKSVVTTTTVKFAATTTKRSVVTTTTVKPAVTTTKKSVVATTVKPAATTTKKSVVTTTTVKYAATTTKKPVVTTTTVKYAATTTNEPTTAENTYVEYRFRTKKLLQQHFSKHGSEFKNDFGYKTAEEYEKGASDVINNPDALHKTEKEDGDGVYYLKNTNEFVILSTDGYIRTYFRPSSGMSYYERQ